MKAHEMIPERLCVGQVVEREYAHIGVMHEASIHVCGEDGTGRGNCVAIVHLGGKGALRYDREAVEATAKAIVSFYNQHRRDEHRNARLVKRLKNLNKRIKAGEFDSPKKQDW